MLSAIISILIGNFLIGLLFKPALEHLREIREELLSVAIPVGDKRAGRFAHQPWDAEKIAAQREAARRAINEIFRKYQLAYGPFKRIGRIFLAALILLVNFTIITAALGLYLKVALCIVLTAVVLGLAVALAKDAYPSPTELWSLDYLVSHFPNVHPDSLISLLDIGIEKITSDDNTRLALSCAVHLTGYKFLVAMTGGNESQRYLVAFGKVSKKTKVTYVITPDDYRWHVPLGEVRFRKCFSQSRIDNRRSG